MRRVQSPAARLLFASFRNGQTREVRQFSSLGAEIIDQFDTATLLQSDRKEDASARRDQQKREFTQQRRRARHDMRAKMKKDPMHSVNNPTGEVQPEATTSSFHSEKRFSQLLSSQLASNVSQHLNSEHASQVQADALPAIAESDNDVVVAAETGSGKTLAYLLPLIEKLSRRDTANREDFRAVVLVPSHELVQQVGTVASRLCRDTPVSVHTDVTGNWPRRGQRSTLLVTTAAHFVESADVQAVCAAKHMVIDEADQVLGDVHKQAMQSLFLRHRQIARRRRRLEELASDPSKGDQQIAAEMRKALATLENEDDEGEGFTNADFERYDETVEQQQQSKTAGLSRAHRMAMRTVEIQSRVKQNVALRYARPQWILAGASFTKRGTKSVDSMIAARFADATWVQTRQFHRFSARVPVDFHVVTTEAERRKRVLAALGKETKSSKVEIPKTLIFGTSSDRVRKYARFLRDCRVAVSEVHSETPAAERARAVERFENAESQVLVSTDLLTRGVDFADVAKVVHLDLPPSATTFLHRCGRTGRAGKDGYVEVLYSPGQADVRSVVSFFNPHMACCPW
ncbi:MAG: hypothetical protein MHM6MM_004730 [Cercozoa sp. M6MM]